MLNNFDKPIIVKPKGGLGYYLGLGLLAIALTQFACGTIFAQQTHVLLEDRKVLVTQLDLSPGESYAVPKDNSGAAWIALDPVLLAAKEDGSQSSRQIKPGDAEVVEADEHLVFRGQTGQHVRLIIVKPKGRHQDLTVSPFLDSASLEDASARNVTLLVAVSACHFRDTRNLGDESEWKPGKPVIITMRPGSVRWIRSGIHHFKNLGPTPVKLVSIEW